jgi:hypothetical protein
MYDGFSRTPDAEPIPDDPGLAAGRRAYAYFRADTEARFLRKLSALFRPALSAVLDKNIIPRFDMPKVHQLHLRSHRLSLLLQ